MQPGSLDGVGVPLLYKGSVKDLLGPLLVPSGEGRTMQSVAFRYSDGFSVFDWGRMGDTLPKKGTALAIMAAAWFEALEEPKNWREFSKSSDALALRKALSQTTGEPVSVSSNFNEVGEKLQRDGLRTHYLGLIKGLRQINAATPIEPVALSQISDAKEVDAMAAIQVHVPRPHQTTVLGRAVVDYSSTTHVAPPKLIPLEVVFRFATPEGSSLLSRLKRDPSSWSEALLPKHLKQSLPEVGTRWEYPLVELFTKLESTDRPVPLAEALAISGLKAAQLEDMLVKTLWVAGFLKYFLRKAGLELADGKLEWAVAPNGECFLVDAIGPDELRLSVDGQPLSKEFLRQYYRKTEWFRAVEGAKEQARSHGIADWKRLVNGSPPLLSPAVRELGSKLYMTLCDVTTQALTERSFFNSAGDLSRVVEAIRDGQLR